MSTRPVTFGAFVPQGWKTELVQIDGAEAKWANAVEIAELAEQLGYDSIWVYDHFHNVPVPAHEAVFESWTTLAALSQRTSRVRLGQMVGCAAYRNPALLAKITSNLDVMSGGRLDWGIGAGWYEHEFRGYGYEFIPARDRIAVLHETVEIVRSMWTEPDTTYTGKWFRLEGAQCDPKPLQRPHPPILIGGAGEQLTLRLVARLASRSNFGANPEEFAHKCDVRDATATPWAATTTRSRRRGAPRSSCARPTWRCGPSADRRSASRSRVGRPATSWARRSR
jgi:F420-dependent oxidoreductase-like protein